MPGAGSCQVQMGPGWDPSVMMMSEVADEVGCTYCVDVDVNANVGGQVVGRYGRARNQGTRDKKEEK